jgi:iron complex outermembrane receptor protein
MKTVKFLILLVLLMFVRGSVYGSEDESAIKESAELTEDVASAEESPQDELSDTGIDKLLAMSLEDLMDLEVTLVSKKKEKLFTAPAAIYVVTAEDIRRSGATSIPEALRMVPGLQVARINSSCWAISSRGFNKEFANKLLVLIDGRSVYTPLFAGVYWNRNDVMMEDVERIEVIRGPGATLWGANAVNGIINIITKKAQDTQGGMLTGGGGTEELGYGAARYGGSLGEKGYFRIYSKYRNLDDGPVFYGGESSDEWETAQGGFRWDWKANETDELTLQGDIYKGQIGHTAYWMSLLPPYSVAYDEIVDVNGGNVLSRWRHVISDYSDLQLQFYYDRTEQRHTKYQETRDIFDLEFQHRFPLGEKQEIIYGLNYRFMTDDSKAEVSAGEQMSFSLDPASRDLHLISAFIQDELTLIEDQLKFTVGSKFEHNDFTGFEYQPSGRLQWTPRQNQTLWSSVSRAVRTPSRYEHDSYNCWGVFPGGGGTPTEMEFVCDEDYDSEELTAYELGYRLEASKSVMLDFAGFFNVYDNLRTYEGQSPTFEMTPAPHMRLPFSPDNQMDGETYGVEVSGNWQVMENWKLAAGYTFLQMQMHPKNTSTDENNESGNEGSSPHNQIHLRSYVNLPRNLEFDTALYYVDNLPALDIPSYFRLDARLGWHISENAELSLAAHNLLDSRHPEFFAWGTQVPTEAERSFFAKLTWRF